MKMIVPERQWVLATGGAGYIGSHVVVELVAAGFGVVILDNFENASPDVLTRLARITGFDIPVVRGDVRDKSKVAETLMRYGIDIVIHLAGKKSVGESVSGPLDYYNANVGGGIAVLEAMRETGVGKLVFSSSATVYKAGGAGTLDENAPVGPSNPYGRTKAMLEEIITDTVASRGLTRAISLRYFNPAGAHHSGLIGENPTAKPNNLFPFIAQTAAGLHPKVLIFGDDYPTPDGTGVRDYIHVVDLARGHVAAVEHLVANAATADHLRVNLGTGAGYSVRAAVAAFSGACGFDVPFEVVARRPGDIAICVADPGRAKQLLGWTAKLSFEQMCADQWAFHRTCEDHNTDRLVVSG
ncbi:MAG: UDP-glucose 4-epimerase GalE [Flavimaricola sp.]|nr:UDP-glucose 4-epimerase GalE [Flavimaricola sp.]